MAQPLICRSSVDTDFRRTVNEAIDNDDVRKK
jgi:hypothetical protein